MAIQVLFLMMILLLADHKVQGETTRAQQYDAPRREKTQPQATQSTVEAAQTAQVA